MPLSIPLYQTELHDCPYLPERMALNQVAEPEWSADAHVSGELNRQGFRRSGQFLYRPHCPGCQACQSLRIPVRDFRPGRTQRRLLQHNADLSTSWLPDIDTDECYGLFARYIEARHADGSMYPPQRDDYRRFLARPPGDYTRFLAAHDSAGTLQGLIVCDRFSDGLSAVFSFYDTRVPARSLGTWLILQVIAAARAAGLPYVYPGFYVAGCRKMAYKARFSPLEILREGHWQPFSPAASASTL